MGLFNTLHRWFTQNAAVTSPFDPDSFLHPRRYAASRAEIVEALRRAAGELPRWRFVEHREIQGRVRLEHRTRLGWVDDVDAYVVESFEGGCTVELSSRSRQGRWDFGQNRRNLREILSRLDRFLGANHA